jgi:hypothetical protein
VDDIIKLTLGYDLYDYDRITVTLNKMDSGSTELDFVQNITSSIKNNVLSVPFKGLNGKKNS